MSPSEKMPLESLQAWMQGALIAPSQTSAKETESIVEASPRLAAMDRLAIYQRSYYLRLIKCMEEQFPALCDALEKDLFDRFAREYLQSLPSVSYTLHELGRRFPDFLEETRPDRQAEKKEEWIDFMIDLARYEWELFSLFDAPGNEGRPFADEATPDRRLKLQPCFKIHQSRFPVAWYYHEVRQQNNPSFPAPRPSFVAIARRDFITRTHPLSETHFRFLEELLLGKSIPQAIETVAQESGQTADAVSRKWTEPGGLRQHWLDAGFFIDGEQAGSLDEESARTGP